MEKRYQVFVSSTYSDLIAERAEVMQALLELECMPSGMELFPAATETQWDWIGKVIDESDYYLVIVGGRYGSVSKETGLSYTEMEYRYAIETGKPVIGFVHEDPSSLPVKSCEQSEARRKQLEAFRELVMSRLCKLYSSPADLGAKVSRSMTQLRKQHPAIGWVRADAMGTGISATEILKLREENDKLQAELAAISFSPPEAANRLASGSDSVEIRYTFTRKVRNEKRTNWRKLCEQTEVVELTWDAIFARLAPVLIDTTRRRWLKGELAELVWERVKQRLTEKYPEERFVDVSVVDEDWNTIILQFRALNLIQCVEGAWELTGYGDNYATSLLAVAKGQTKRTPLPDPVQLADSA